MITNAQLCELYQLTQADGADPARVIVVQDSLRQGLWIAKLDRVRVDRLIPRFETQAATEEAARVALGRMILREVRDDRATLLEALAQVNARISAAERYAAHLDSLELS